MWTGESTGWSSDKILLVWIPISVSHLPQKVASYPQKKLQQIQLRCEKTQLYFHLGLAVFEPRDFMTINAMLSVKRCVKAQLCSVS